MIPILTQDQVTVLDYITAEEKGWGTAPMPFKLARYRGIRDNLIRLGFITKTESGRFVPTRTSLCAPDKQSGQAARPLEGIA